MTSKEYLRRIDERNYLTEREHREFLERLSKDLEILETIKDLLNDGVLWLEMEHEMIESKEHKKKKQLIKEWLNNGK